MFLPIICWDFIKLKEIINALVTAGFRGLRIFFNLRDLPYIKKPTQAYIQHCFDTMPNGMHTFTYEGSPSPDVPKDMMRDSFLLCKRLNWFPMVCLGTSEESVPNDWIGRVPSPDKYEWLGQFAQELGTYLRYNMGFERTDCEIWNEFTKCMTPNQYCDVSIPITDGWYNSKAGKVWVFSDDILRQDKLNAVLARKDLMTRPGIAGITTHAGVGAEDSEFDQNLILKTTVKLKLVYPNLNQFVSELTFNGRWERRFQLAYFDKDGNKHYNTAGFGLIGAVRVLVKDHLLGTRMDDIWLINSDGTYRGCSSDEKAEILSDFKDDFYIKYEVVEDDMILKQVYEQGMRRELGIYFIQLVLNKDMKPVPLLTVDGWWGDKTNPIVLAYQKKYSLSSYSGQIGPNTVQHMIETYPGVWNRFEYLNSIPGGIKLT